MSVAPVAQTGAIRSFLPSPEASLHTHCRLASGEEQRETAGESGGFSIASIPASNSRKAPQ